MKENHARPGRRSMLTANRSSDGSIRDLDLKAKRRYDKEGHESVLKIRVIIGGGAIDGAFASKMENMRYAQRSGGGW